MFKSNKCFLLESVHKIIFIRHLYKKKILARRTTDVGIIILLHIPQHPRLHQSAAISNYANGKRPQNRPSA